jgi:hypothetical protein
LLQGDISFENKKFIEKATKWGELKGYLLILFFCAQVILEKEYLYNKRRQT